MFNIRDDQEEKYLFIKFLSFSAFIQVNASIICKNNKQYLYEYHEI